MAIQGSQGSSPRLGATAARGEPSGSQSKAIRVLVVDDHEVVRSGVAALLERESDIKVVGMVGSGEEAIDLMDSTKPDVVMLDYRLPGMSGTVACREILARHPHTSVLMLTSFLEDDIIHAALVAGARGYVLKNATRSDLTHLVRAVARGEAVLGPEVTERVIEWARRSKSIQQGGDLLIPHEVQLMMLVAQGLSNKEIGRTLRTSEYSVKLQLRTIMRKLGAKKRQEAVAAALRRGAI